MIINGLLFVSKKKGSLFSYPYAISPLIAKNKMQYRQMLSLRFLRDDLWHYDPMGIISTLKKQVGLSTYVHEERLEVEKLANIITSISDTMHSTTSMGMIETDTQVGSRNSKVQMLEGDEEPVFYVPATPAF